jgi:hypothetical protein
MEEAWNKALKATALCILMFQQRERKLILVVLIG